MKKLICGLVWSIVALLAVSVGSIAYLFGGDEKRETVTVPNFEGKRLDDIDKEARFIFENEGVYCEKTEGEIIEQTPMSGSKRKLVKGEKCRVRLKISLGEKRENIPDVVGFNYIEAANALREIGLTARIVPIFGEEERDIVLSTSPEVGSEVRSGDKVTLFVSRQRINGSVRVGDYVGLEKSRAIAILLRDGLSLGEITIEYSDEYPEGSVMGQSIMKDAYVPYGSEISLTVSGGNMEKPRRRLWRRKNNDKNGEINGSDD